MNKTELSAASARKTELSKKDAEKALKAFTDVVTEELKKGEKIDKLLLGGYSTMSLGYIGLYELTWLMKGCSHTNPKGKEFALRVMDHLKDTAARWKEETGIGFSLYGTPAEGILYQLLSCGCERTY